MCGLPSAENRENFAFLTKNFQENAVGHGVRMPEARRRDRGADRGCGRKPVGLTGVQAGVEAAGRNPCNGAWYGWNPGGVGGRILPRSCHPSGVPSISVPFPRGSAALRPCLYSCVPCGDLCRHVLHRHRVVRGSGKPGGLTGIQAGVEAAGRNPCNGAWYGWNPGGVGGRILPRSCHPSGVPSMSMPSPRGSAALRPCLYSCVPFGDLCCTVIPPLSIFLRPLRGLQPCRVFLSVAADDFFSGTTYFGQESRVICY